jgi:hypothetical protein
MPKPKVKKVKVFDFDSFARILGKAVRLGRAHWLARQAQATPAELATVLNLPNVEPVSRSVYLLFIREAYLAGYNFSNIHIA